jgi:hypothetical protein
MDQITLIVTALAAGASAGTIDALRDDVKESAKASYRKLHDLVKRRFTGNARAEAVLAKYQGDPKTWEAPLAKELADAGADDDADLAAAARALMELVDQNGAESGKYNVTIKDSKGVQVGDDNLQINTF